jgi:adenylate kinase
LKLLHKFEGLRIGITGSPATGKKSVALELSKLTGLKTISLNEIAIKKNIKGEFAVDTHKLKKIKIDTRGKIVYGHLLPYVIPKGSLDFVAILRCSPNELRRRYRERNYSNSKIEDNVASEVLDIISVESLRCYGKRKVAEFVTTRTRNPNSVALKIIATISGKIPRHYGVISWSKKASLSPRDLRTVLGVL